jgi:hypothetical protein
MTSPSESARMVCAREAQEEIASAIGVQAQAVTTPTWVDHVYSCMYRYPKGAITLSVKELPNLAATAAYYKSLGEKLGIAGHLYSLGQGAFITPGGDAVVRKDYKVMHVDVSGLRPDSTWPLSRKDVAESITTTIMGCWTGA